MNTELTYELHDYVLVDNNGKAYETVKLTKREVFAKNQGFGLNHVSKRYILKREFKSDEPGPILIVPKG
jgi:hypothetical protein